NEARIKTALVIMKEIDDVVKNSSPEDIEQGLAGLKEKMFKYSLSTVCEKSELQFPLTNKSFKWLSIIKAVLFPVL
ncbi:MAG TPA: hypothetical protein VIK09_06605, partial [Candidatus Humimicrobiaceae bacterium]